MDDCSSGAPCSFDDDYGQIWVGLVSRESLRICSGNLWYLWLREKPSSICGSGIRIMMRMISTLTRLMGMIHRSARYGTRRFSPVSGFTG